MRVVIAVLLAATATGCHSGPRLTAAAWPAADGLFRGSLDWRGGDSAYSARLGPKRVLWLFGDSIVGRGKGPRRAFRTMVHNTIGLQLGGDPDRARMRFLYGHQAGKAAAFFETGDAKTWLWPGPAVRLRRGLLLTFVEVTEAKGGLGFRTIGSRARLVPRPNADPGSWRPIPVVLPPTPYGARFGTGAFLLHGGELYAYLTVEPGDHDVYLARWSRADVERHLLLSPRWWTGRGWSPDYARAAVIVGHLQTELSVDWDASIGRFVMISVDGFGRTNIVARTARRPEGPWSKPVVIYRPPESDMKTKGVLVYSAKAHRLADGGLAVTYCSNDLDFWTMAAHMDLYFPRFVRIGGR